MKKRALALHPDLFEAEDDPPPLHHVTARPASIKRTRVGMRRAEHNAGEPWWNEALAYVRRYAALQPEFLGEDCRHWAERNGCEPPPHKRAWGPLLLKAEKLKIIRRVGMGRAADSNQAWVVKWARCR